MAEKSVSVRKPVAAKRGPAVAARLNAPAAAARPTVPAGRALQQRLGNRGAQAFAAQAVARSGARDIAPTNSAGTRQFTLSQPGDTHEREAERVADRVMRMAGPAPGQAAIFNVSTPTSASAVYRRCAACEEAPAHAITRDTEAAAIEVRVQRHEAAAATSAITPSVSADIRALQGKGRPLPPAIRAFFEPRFSASFGQVRIHTDTLAARTASGMNAKAFTVGRDIAFAAGQFSPDTQPGRRLLAHELTHVVQQGHSTARSHGAAASVQRDPADTAPLAVKNDPALVAELNDELASWKAGANQDGDKMLRAKATRMVLLLEARTRPVLATRQDLDAFTADCARRGLTELDTLGAFSPAAAEGALYIYAKGFPLTWSGRIAEALSLGADQTVILQTSAAAATKLKQRTISLGPQLATEGLPVPYTALERLNDFQLRLSDATADESSPVREYAAEGIRYVQLKWLLSFAFAWEGLANKVAEAVADGELEPKPKDYDEFVKDKQAILRGLRARAAERMAQSDAEIEKIQTDAVGLADTALLIGFASALTSLFGILGGWNDVTASFKDALANGDSNVAAEGSFVHLGRALKWAWYNSYYSGAAAATGRAMWEGAPEALGETAVYIVGGMVPVLNVGLAVYLFFKLGVDVVEMLVELASAIKDVIAAKTVCDLQKASAKLATILMRAAIFVAILAATWGIGKAIGKLNAAKAKAKAANPALTEEQATSKAMRELSKEEREALAGRKAKLAESIGEKFEEIADACVLGSVLCNSVPKSIEKEVGKPPPTQYNVPPPKGKFTIQHADFAEANRRPKFLQQQVLQDPGRWPHFEKALKESGGKWPVDENGKAWEVHHIKPAGMGGGSEIDNLFPLPKADHKILTNYWSSVRLAIKRRFTDAEWDAIYTRSTKDVRGADLPKSPLP